MIKSIKTHRVFKFFLIISYIFFGVDAGANLPTYFTYTDEELAPLKALNSLNVMNKEELSHWDLKMQKLINENKDEENDARIRAYLDVAQRDAAYLSFNLNQQFEGSLNSISKEVLSLFFSKLQSERNTTSADTYSALLAQIVLNKMKARINEEKQITKPYEIKEGPQYWKGKWPYYGWGRSSWKPWLISSANAFRLPPPPPLTNPIWKEQIAKVKEASENLTDKQKKIILYWAGQLEENGSASGDWVQIAMNYMISKNVPLDKMLFVRSILAMALEDAAIACYDSKYTYFMLRPNMQDSSIKTFVLQPNHPSYPAGHSTAAGTASAVLSYFFPENANQWKKAAEEAGISRIWAGIHYPLDVEMGWRLGHEVGEAVIESQSDKR